MNHVSRNFILGVNIYLFCTQITIEKDAAEGACNMHGRYEKCIQNFGRKS
jgi:hypothetical protein